MFIGGVQSEIKKMEQKIWTMQSGHTQAYSFSFYNSTTTTKPTFSTMNVIKILSSQQNGRQGFDECYNVIN